ncbi:MAG: glutathione S-transferase [Minwuia sp.]|nr:glutathione S-transferase [Minwuia sp.]
MLTVHHLNNSRSQRILWLMEELGLDYELKKYQRNAETNLAPPELIAVHPLGKSPVLTEGDHTIIESGAIIDYVIRRHGGGKLQPDPATADYDSYVQWLQYAEGSAMLPLMLFMYVGRLGEAGAPLHPRIESEIANHVGYINRHLEGREFLIGDSLTGADINLSFVGEILGPFGKRGTFPNVDRWIADLHKRPAWQTALEKGGAYAFA